MVRKDFAAFNPTPFYAVPGESIYNTLIVHFDREKYLVDEKDTFWAEITLGVNGKRYKGPVSKYLHGTTVSQHQFNMRDRICLAFSTFYPGEPLYFKENGVGKEFNIILTLYCNRALCIAPNSLPATLGRAEMLREIKTKEIAIFKTVDDRFPNQYLGTEAMRESRQNRLETACELFKAYLDNTPVDQYWLPQSQRDTQHRTAFVNTANTALVPYHDFDDDSGIGEEVD